MMYLQAVAGFALLLGGAELMLRGAVQVAARMGISPLVIGMTVVALGTSAPELLVSLQAALSGSPGIALGNVVGSNIANVLLILGVTGVVVPIVCRPGAHIQDGIVLMIGSIVFAWLCLLGDLGLGQGLVLLFGFFAFLTYSYWRETHGNEVAAAAHVNEVADYQDLPSKLWLAWLVLILGLAGLVFGADQLISGGLKMARVFGVSEEVIGLTMIALGTSLPELAASVVAAVRGHPDLALGNVVGSNLFNVFGVMGVVSVVTPLAVPDQIRVFDLWVMLITTALLVFFLVGGQRIRRAEGAAFLVGYILYIAAQAYGVSGIVPQASG